MRFKPGGPEFRYETFTLGEDLLVRFRNRMMPCRFIKVTRRGFNILHLSSHKCLLRKPAYLKGMANKNIEPNRRGEIKGEFLIPDYLKIIHRPLEDAKGDRTCLGCGRQTCDRQPEDYDPVNCKDWKEKK